MPLQEIVAPWDQQPQEWAELSELARQLGASDLLLPVGSTLAPVNSLLTANGTNGTLAETVNAQGRGVQFTTGGAYFLDRGANDPRNGYWWMIVGSISAVGTWSGLFSRTKDNTTTNSLGWQRQSGDDQLSIYHDDGGARADMPGLNALLASTVSVWIGTWDKTTGELRLYRDGLLVRSATLVTAPGYASGQGQIKVFSSRDTAQASGVVDMAAFGTVTPTAAQVAELSGNPWALLQRREWVPMAAASGGGVTGASSGTLELSGSAAGSVLVSGASAGTLAIGGTAAAAVRVTGASSGTLSLSGTATGTVGATGVTGQSSQTLSLTGASTATVRVSGQSAQTLALSGTAAGSVRVSGASAGTLSITGTATGNTTGAVTGASAGVLSLSGGATGTVRVSGGSAAVLQITGNAGAQIVVRGVSAGALSMTGSASGTTGGAEPEPTSALAKYTITARARKTVIQAKARRMEVKA